MSFPRYPKYKDSGVEWLGEVPEHWEVIPLKASHCIHADGSERHSTKMTTPVLSTARSRLSTSRIIADGLMSDDRLD